MLDSQANTPSKPGITWSGTVLMVAPPGGREPKTEAIHAYSEGKPLAL